MDTTGKIKTPSFNPLPQKLIAVFTKIKSPQRIVLPTRWKVTLIIEIIFSLLLIVMFAFYLLDQRQMIRISVKKQVQNLTRLEETYDEISRNKIPAAPRTLTNQALTLVYEIVNEDESIARGSTSVFLLSNFLPKTDSLVLETENFIGSAKNELKIINSDLDTTRKQIFLLQIDKKIESISIIKKHWQNLLESL